MARQTVRDIIERDDPHDGRGVATRSLPVNLLRSLRPSQWTKNLIIFAALGFSERLLLFDPRAIAYAITAFVVFCALSGAVYLVNDVIDRDADRRHPLKQ